MYNNNKKQNIVIFIIYRLTYILKKAFLSFKC